ncbi:ABC transporter substrate-binding protein [bacterium]|nr:ABC transporter substrate-binding protein [bacterium]
MKFFVFYLIIFCAFTLTSCRKQDKHEISVAIGGAPSELDFWNDIIKNFEKKNGCKIKFLRQSSDTDQNRQQLIIALRAKKRNPDLFLMDTAWIVQFAASQWLEPLDQYFSHDKIDKSVFFKKIITLSDTYKNELIALPVYVDAGMLYYRKDLLNKYGFNNPPNTWQELVDQSIKIQKKERRQNPNFYGFVWQGAQYEGLVCCFLEFAGSNNGGFINKNFMLKLNNPANRQSLQFMYDLIHTYKISPPNTYTEMREDSTRLFFENANALFQRNWPYAWALLQKDSSPVKGKIGIAPLPHFPSGKSAAALGGWHIGMSKFSDNKPLAWKFIKYVISYDTQKKFTMELGWNPGRQDLYNDPDVLRKNPHFSKLKQIFRNALARPNVPYYTQISNCIQKYLNAAIAGKIPIAQSLKRADNDLSKIIKNYEQK